jgi:hypothetical protein
MARVLDVSERLAQGIAERVVALVVDALDVDALLARIDVEALIARVDIEAVLARIDVEALVARIDLTSTATATASNAAEETLAALRRTAVRGDELAAGWAGRMVGRR